MRRIIRRGARGRGGENAPWSSSPPFPVSPAASAAIASKRGRRKTEENPLGLSSFSVPPAWPDAQNEEGGGGKRKEGQQLPAPPVPVRQPLLLLLSSARAEGERKSARWVHRPVQIPSAGRENGIRRKAEKGGGKGGALSSAFNVTPAYRKQKSFYAEDSDLGHELQRPKPDQKKEKKRGGKEREKRGKSPGRSAVHQLLGHQV